MEIFEINNLDCSYKTNRIALVKATMKALKTDEQPTKKELETICKKLNKKYGYRLKGMKQQEGTIFVSVKFQGGYHTMACHSYYEMMCKYILLVKQFVKWSKMEAK